MPAFSVHITYCGAWGYFGRFTKVKKLLEANIKGLTVDGTGTEEASGAFEVVNVSSKKVYHSKIGGGGYLDDNKDKLLAVVKAIQEDFAAE